MVVVEFEGGNINCEIVNKPNGGILQSTLCYKSQNFSKDKFENPIVIVIKLKLLTSRGCIVKILLADGQLGV